MLNKAPRLLLAALPLLILPATTLAQPSTEIPPPPTTNATTEPTPEPTTEPSPPTPEQVAAAIAAFRLDTLKKVTEELATLRVLPPAKLADIFRFQIDPTGLIVQTPLLETDGDVTFPLQDHPGFVRLALSGKPTTELATPNSFKLILHRFDDPTVTYSQVDVWTNAIIGQFQLAFSAESLNHNYTVQLIQSMRIQGELNTAPEEALRLLVRRYDLDSNETTIDVKLAAPDFPTLRRKYPRETSMYLRPIFAELGQLSPLFVADQRAAWQVLGIAPELNPADEQHLKDLLARLEADKFSDRQKAQRELKSLGQQAALALRAFDRSSLTPNQNAEIDAFLAAYSPLDPEEIRRLSQSPDFLLDCMELEDPKLRSAAWDKFFALPPTALPAPLPPTLTFSPSASPELRAPQITALRAHLSPPISPSTQPTTLPSPSTEPVTPTLDLTPPSTRPYRP